MQTAGSPLLEVDTARAVRLVDFAARLRGLHVRRAALHAGLRMLLLWGAPAILAVWLAPGLWWVGSGVLLGVAAVAALVAGWRARRIAAAALLRSGEGDAAALGVVGDELATWLEWSPRRAGTAMVAWLERDVDAQLPKLSPVALQGVGRRRFGRLLYLLPVLALLLLALLLSWWFQPPWPGVLGGAPEPPPPPPRVESTPGPGDSSPRTAEPSPSPERDPPPTPAGTPPPSPDDPAPPPPAEPPAPLLDLPGQQHFVLPDHIDDGPTRRMRMHAAELPEPTRAGSSSPPTAAAGGAESIPPPPPPPAAEQFQRAAEQAARARHVPAAEQAIVRRFFDQLQKAAR